MNKIWKIKNKISNIKDDNFRIKADRIIKILLENRGLKTKKQIEEFLNPANPYDLSYQVVGIQKNEIDKAVKRIIKAIKAKENIIIYGDYDADGITATAIMWEALYSLGAKVLPFIPQRENLGYGLKKEGIDLIFKLLNLKTIKLIITVDNGIVAHKGVDFANKKGIDVIISDHHQKKLKAKSLKLKAKYDLPAAHSIIWSDKVSGAGVAWFLAKKIYQSFHKNLIGFKQSNSLELACIGTITDLMPVAGVNRSLIKYGLKELQQSKRQGMVALCKAAGISQSEIGTYGIGYLLGPRLNAMGRLENALYSLRLLCTKNNQKAVDLAYKLDSTNRERQQLTQATYEHARKNSKINPPAGQQSSKLIFIAHKSYNQGVIGLVAGKLVEEYYKPAVVISKGKIYSKASVRSINGFDIIKALRKFSSLYEDIGGHPMAAGFTIKTQNINLLEKKLQKLVEKEIKNELLEPKIKVDLEINLSDITWELADKIEKFSPFGIGNSKPTFVSRKVKIVNLRTVGRDRQHLKLTMQQCNSATIQPSVYYEAIGFRLGYLISKLQKGQLIDICYQVEKNVWNGNENIQLNIKDIKYNFKN